MAKHRRDEQLGLREGSAVMPLRLARFNPEDGLDSSAQRRAQREWLREHGVDPADSRRVLALVNEAKREHGVPTVDDRVRRLVEAGKLGPAPRSR